VSPQWPTETAMLYLKPPFYMVNGVALFADHANERQFYYMPAMPHLTTTPEQVNGTQVDVPQIQLLKFRGGAGNGGFLTFEVNLGIPQAALDDIAMEVKRLFRLRDNPIMSPVILEGGTVRLIILGRASDQAGQPVLDDDQQPRFVTKIEHASSPALYGDNNAIFSVELDQEGVELIENSLIHSELMPVGVVYSLDFLALRPAFSVKITADWNRIQTHFEESFKADVLFSSTEIDKVVDKLVEDQVVKIEVDSFLPEGEDAGSWVGRRDQAINDFKDMVLKNFFKPSLEPIKDEEDGWDKATNFAEDLSTLAVTGGWGAVAKFSYTKKDMTRIDQKSANLTMNERVTVKRSIYPQATLKGLGRVLKAAQAAVGIDRFIQAITLDDDWFDKRSLKANSLVDFDNDKVESVNLTLTYNGQPRTIRLTKDKASDLREWNSLIANNAMVRPVEYEYQVSFRGVDTADRPGILVSPRRTTVGDEFEVSPRGEGLYFLDDIQIGASILPWDRYPQVEVEVRYSDPAHGIHLGETFMLSKTNPEATWKRFRLDPNLSNYDVRMTFLAVDHQDIVYDWRTTDQERLIIRDPHPLRRTIQLAPAVDWRVVSMIFVELRYLDSQNGVDEQQTLAFFDTPQDRVPKTFSISLVDGNQRLVSYTTTFVLKDNRTIVVPASMTMGSTIILRSDMAGHRIVTVAPPEVDFAARGIVRIEAQLSYQDADNGLAFSDKFTVASARDVNYFEFDYVSPTRSTYSCTVTVVLANGLVVEHDLGTLNGDRVTLPTG
jgi:hypothetical protein